MTRGPAWLDNAAWPYVRSRYQDAVGHADYDAFQRAEVSRARGISKSLRGMEASDGYHGDDFPNTAAVGFLAIDWLADRAGDPALFEYYRLLPDSKTWEDAFEAAFGIAVDDFYEQFEAYRTRVAPPR